MLVHMRAGMCGRVCVARGVRSSLMELRPPNALSDAMPPPLLPGHVSNILSITVRDFFASPVLLPGPMQVYFDCLSTYNHPGPDGMAILTADLPSAMRTDLACETYCAALTRMELFEVRDRWGVGVRVCVDCSSGCMCVYVCVFYMT